MTTPTRAAGPVSSGRPGSPRLEEVAERVFAYVQPGGGWCVNNAGVLLDRGRTVVVDTAATQARATALRSAVEGLTVAPVRLLVNTHFHSDHTFGNVVVGPAAVIVAHDLVPAEMTKAGLGIMQLWPEVGWGEIQLATPSLTYRDRLTLHLDGLRAELRHVGPAHTTNDTVVWLPDHRVLFAGDLLMPQCTPFVLMGSVAGSLLAVEELRALNPQVVVAGHGPVSGPEVLDETAAYLNWIQRVAADGFAAGATPLELGRDLRDTGSNPFSEWVDPERVVGNLHRAYAELRGEPHGHPLDVVGIFGELIDYHGGPLPCCA